MKRTLFLSFQGAVEAFCKGEIVLEDLARGLFFFGSLRETFYKFSQEPVMHQNPYFHLTLAAVFLSEGSGRCIWLKEGEKPLYAHLNRLLRDNNIAASLSAAELAVVNPDKVERLIRLAGLARELQVVL